MPLDLVGASMDTRYNSTLSGESMDSGPLPLAASSPPTTISDTWASNGSSLMSRSVLLRFLMWPSTPVRPLAMATFSYRRMFTLLRMRMPWRRLLTTLLPHSRLSALS
ncbi:hypothetical protein D9M69_528190 [compost metagenome]